MKPRLSSLLIASIAILALACATAVPQAATSPPDVGRPPQQTEAGTESAYEKPDAIPLIKGPVSPEGYQAIFATPDLGVGENRIAVVVTSPTGLVRSPGATMSSTFFPPDGSEGIRRETTLAIFHEFPLATRGLYTATMTFDQPGSWGIDVTVLDEGGVGRQVELSFNVMQKTAAPAIGAPAIPSVNKTLSDVDTLADLTTGSTQNEDLYRHTIAEAIASGRPTVVVMASPAFCTNAVCGPQVDVLSELQDKYDQQANFIHVDFYDNPQQIQGDLRNAVISPTVKEWNLPSTEWSFVIDSEGVVAARFESFAGFSEIELALKKLL